MRPVTHEGYKLFHEGAIAFSQVELNGIKIDTDYIKTAIKKTDKQIKILTNDIQSDKLYKTWRKQYGKKINIGSGEQMGHLVFEILGYPVKERTKTGKAKVDAFAFSDVDLPIVNNFVKLEHLKKAKTTYLEGILNETVNDFLHPFFNLHTAKTFRSSSSSPNFQNMPVRDPEMAELIRRAFIARKNRHIVEVDYSGAEIGCAACYHLDPVMIKYIKDDSKDLHRDMAQQLYMLPKNEMRGKGKKDKKRIKDIRYCSKNKFVFPEFYGDWYMSCAKSLWEAIGIMNLQCRNGSSLYDHLADEGISKLGACDPKQKPRKNTFEKHLKDIEDDFWNRRFKVYGQWKEDWYTEYLKKGYIDTLSGFRIEGVMSRKEIINYPVQGSAFHWLLWSLIRIQKLLKKYKMKSLIIGQIHDSIVGDVLAKELKDYLDIVQQVMTVDVRKHWPWIIVPLSIEAEVTPKNGNWFQKEEVTL
jgi:DNA polymerase I-like protein with 3'-5' exonuclease and polymerase domains